MCVSVKESKCFTLKLESKVGKFMLFVRILYEIPNFSILSPKDPQLVGIVCHRKTFTLVGNWLTCHKQ